jgi:hypothetical protein
MAEAQKMMNDPAFQAHMNKVMESQAFKAHMQQQQAMLKDPKKVKELEAKMQEKLKEGNELLEEAQAARAKLLAEKGESANAAAADDKMESKGDKKEESDEKQAATETETPAEEDEMPDIPNLNLN